MAMVMVIKSEFPPPVRITPPWAIMPPRVIIVGIWAIIVFLPKVDLFVQKKRISIIHFTQGFDLLSKNFTGHGDLPSSPEEVRIQIFPDKNQETPL
jgi:hypothetical protein